MKIWKTITYILAGLLLIVSLNAAGSIVCVQAADMVLMELQETVQVRESEDEAAAIVVVLPEGTSVIAIAEGKNNTIQIQYQG